MRRDSFIPLLIAVMVANHLLGGLITLAYFLFVDSEPLFRMIAVLISGATLPCAVGVGVLVALSSLYLWLARYLRPMRQWMRTDAAGEIPSPEQAQKVVALPTTVALLTCIHWLLVGMLFAVLFVLAGASLSRAAMLFLGTLWVSGLATAVVMYQSVEVIVQRYLPLVFPPETLDHLVIQRHRVPVRLFLIWLQIGVLPLILFAGAAWTGRGSAWAVQAEMVQHIRHMWFVVVMAGLGNLVSAVGVWRSVVRPLEQLEVTMQRVFESGDLYVRLPVRSVDEFGRLAAGLNRMLAGLQEHQRLRDLFGRYMSTEIAREVLENGSAVRAREMDATVLFVDVRGFTQMTEDYPPVEVLGMLNRFFEIVVPTVLRHRGVINKFGGDSVLAIFGVPVPQADHARCAVQAAMEILHAMPSLRMSLRQSGFPDVSVGMGLASGRVVAGNVGSHLRMEYTVLGDVVNLAARLEELTRRYSVPLLISEETWLALDRNQQLAFSSLGQVSIRGRKSSCRLFTVAHPASILLAVKPEEVPIALAQMERGPVV